MIEKLTAKIQSLVPELMELSFGCRIKHKEKGELTFISQKYCQKKEHDSEYGCNDVDYCNSLACLDEANRIIYGNVWTPYKVLGHPITLEHCRVALRREIEKGAVIWELDYSNADEYLCHKWQDLQPWEEQKEVHDFLSQYLLTNDK